MLSRMAGWGGVCSLEESVVCGWRLCCFGREVAFVEVSPCRVFVAFFVENNRVFLGCASFVSGGKRQF